MSATDLSHARVGLVGLGLMGHGIGRNLLKKGFPLAVLGNVNRKPVDSLVGLGARDAGDVKSIVTHSDVIILCVTSSTQIEDLMYRENGMLANLRAGQYVVDCSTSDPRSSEKICKDLNAIGVTFVDAPLGRSPVEAEAGTLNTMVGATPQTLEEIRPILSAYCENIIHVGDVLTAHKLKLINNLVIVGTSCLLAEALKACNHVGVAPSAMYDLMGKGPLNSRLLDIIAGEIIAGRYDGLKFSIGNAAKDIAYFNSMMDAFPRGATLSGALGAVLNSAVDQGLSDAFLPNIAQVD